MQYSVLIALSIAIVAYVAYRAIRYRRSFSTIFIVIDDAVLRDAWRAHEKACSFERFKECWLALSRNIDCPEGKMLANMPLQEIARSYPFPEQLLDDLLEDKMVIDAENPISGEALLSDLVTRCCSAGSVSG